MPAVCTPAHRFAGMPAAYPSLFSRDDAAAWTAALATYPDAIARMPMAEKLAPLDAWYRETLPGLVTARAPMHVTHDEMVHLTEWKMARGVWRAPNLVLVRNNPPAMVADASSRAAALLDQPAKALGAITELGGVGPATASAVLAIMVPERFPFFDDVVSRQVTGLGPVAWTAGYYRKYAAALVARFDALRGVLPDGWTPVTLERALWAYGIMHGEKA